MTYKENITAILECYFAGFKKEIIDNACNRILEQEPCVVQTKDLSDDEIKKFVEEMKKVGVQVKPYEPDLDRIREKINREEKWLEQAGYNAYNVEIAFNAIKRSLNESEGAE